MPSLVAPGWDVVYEWREQTATGTRREDSSATKGAGADLLGSLDDRLACAPDLLGEAGDALAAGMRPRGATQQPAWRRASAMTGPTTSKSPGGSPLGIRLMRRRALTQPQLLVPGSPAALQAQKLLDMQQVLKKRESVERPPSAVDAHFWERKGGGTLEPFLRAAALLDASWLVAHAARGRTLKPRQRMPNEAYVSLAELKASTLPTGGLPIIALSHPWLSHDHPGARANAHT